MRFDLLGDYLISVGAVLLLGAYALVSANKLGDDSTCCQPLNLLGCALLIVNSAHDGACRSVGFNVVWIGVAIFAILRPRVVGQ